MNLPHTQGGAGEAGAVDLGGSAQAAPANPRYQVGAVGFGPVWSVEDSMAASIVRLEQENDELRAEVALLREEQNILSKRLDARVDPAGIAAEDNAGVIEGSPDVSSDSDLSPRTNFPNLMTHERIMTGEECVLVNADFARRLERERDTACRLLAQMHAAAVGEIRGPDIDPITDILNLRKERDQWRECAEILACSVFVARKNGMLKGGIEGLALFERLKEASK